MFSLARCLSLCEYDIVSLHQNETRCCRVLATSTTDDLMIYRAYDSVLCTNTDALGIGYGGPYCNVKKGDTTETNSCMGRAVCATVTGPCAVLHAPLRLITRRCSSRALMFWIHFRMLRKPGATRIQHDPETMLHAAKRQKIGLLTWPV